MIPVLARKNHVIMCTNAILLDRFYRKAKPHERLPINDYESPSDVATMTRWQLESVRDPRRAALRWRAPCAPSTSAAPRTNPTREVPFRWSNATVRAASDALRQNSLRIS